MLVVFAVMVGHACRLICLFNVFCNLVVNVPPIDWFDLMVFRSLQNAQSFLTDGFSCLVHSTVYECIRPPPRRDSIMTNTCFNGCVFLAPQTPSLHEWKLHKLLADDVFRRANEQRTDGLTQPPASFEARKERKEAYIESVTRHSAKACVVEVKTKAAVVNHCQSL
jgi:hypothetical protein